MITEYIFSFIILIIIIITVWYANNITFDNASYAINNNYTYGGKASIIDKSPSKSYPKIIISSDGSSSGKLFGSVSIATNLELIKKPEPPPRPKYPKIIMGSGSENTYTYIDQELQKIDYNIFKDPNPLDLVENNYHEYEYKNDLKNINVGSQYLQNRAEASLIFYEDDIKVRNTGQEISINLNNIDKYYSTHVPSNISGVYGPNTNTYNPNYIKNSDLKLDNVKLYNDYEDNKQIYKDADNRIKTQI